jgi:hypothetical protein
MCNTQSISLERVDSWRKNLLLYIYCGPILCPRSDTHYVLHLCNGSKLGIRVTVLISLLTNTSIKTRTLKHSHESHKKGMRG